DIVQFESILIHIKYSLTILSIFAVIGIVLIMYSILYQSSNVFGILFGLIWIAITFIMFISTQYKGVVILNNETKKLIYNSKGFVTSKHNELQFSDMDSIYVYASTLWRG